MLSFIAEKKRCLACGLIVCGCLIVGEATLRAADAEEHALRAPLNIAAPLAPTTTATSSATVALTLYSLPPYALTSAYLDEAFPNSISEAEHRLMPIRPALTEERRQALEYALSKILLE